METETPTWEHFKENAAPLERGRNVHILEQTYHETAEEREAKENSVRHYESLVLPSEEMAANREELGEQDDPLIHWLSYIKFHQDHFPSDKQSQFLLMERCTRTLVDQKKYANDIRFIRICIMYADQNTNPGEIFKFFHDSRVGSMTSLFWVAWSYWAEKEKNFKLAEKIFKKGRSKKALPANLLEQRYKQFQRRMARYLANQAQEEEDEEMYERGSRGVLGGLSEEAFRRNDRSSARNAYSNNENSNPHQQATNGRGFPQSSMSTFVDRSAGNHASQRRQLPPSNIRKNGSSNNSHVSTGFHIFVEGGQENDGYGLDQELPVHGKRQLARAEDRRKENTIAAEPWNQRGALHSTSTSHFGGTSGRPGALQPSAPKARPFAVFVDEECARKHEQEQQTQQAEEDQRRRHRDERTFRNLEVGESVVERLKQDPLRYMKNPSKVQGDKDKAQPKSTKDEANQREKSRRAGTKSKDSWGFDTSLLRDPNGHEQCFEEYRLFCGQFKVASSEGNFNLLHQAVDESRQTINDSEMDIDESMEDATRSYSVAGTSARKENSRRVLFSNNASFEMRNKSVNASQCSSTVNSAFAVGVDNPEEETINTKWAMKEMSMMFYSPAAGLLDTAAKKAKQAETETPEDIIPGFGEQQASFDSRQQETTAANNSNSEAHNNSGNDTAGFEVMLDLVESLDNSVLHSRADRDDEAENQGPRNPHSRVSAIQSQIDKEALQPLREESTISLSCHSGDQRSLGPLAQHDPLSRARVNELQQDPGFAIFQDTTDTKKEVQTQSAGFSIFNDEASARVSQAAKKPSSGFQILDENEQQMKRPKTESSNFKMLDDREDQSKQKKSATSGFQIFDEGAQQEKPTSGFQIFDEGAQDPKPLAMSNTKQASVPFSIHMDQDSGDTTTDTASLLAGDGGDTASLSIVGDLFTNTLQDDDSSVDTRQSKSRRDARNSFSASIITDPQGFGDISVIQKDPTAVANRALIASPTMTMNFGLMNAVDYRQSHRSNVKSALSRIKQSASDSIGRVTSLSELMSAKHLVYDVPAYVQPRVFKAKLVDRGAEIRIGVSSGTVAQELGRGAYGVVVLMNGDTKSDVKMAVKGQTDAETLAWEYEILKKVESRIEPRLGSQQKRANEMFPYPKPIAFAALAAHSGGIMSMTAASESGLNLVDVVNLYKVRQGSSVPESIALFYATRMMKHLENLHWHGKILHCDVKPDNWVLAGVSELVLVDFGRAVDLSELATAGVDAMDVKLTGEAAEKDMQCVAMRKNRPWSFDADSFGLCASLHVLLFGTHLEIEQKGKRWLPKQRFRRYWQVDLLNEIFDTLLNSDEGTLIGSRPRSLRSLRKKLETYLQNERRKLDDELGSLERMLPTNRSQLNPTGKR